MEDKLIVELYLARDKRAITESDLRYGYTCTRIAQNILDNAQDAENCVREALRCAWDVIPPARPVKLGAYLSKTTRSLALGQYRGNHAAKRDCHLFSMVMDELSECVPVGSTGFGGGFDEETEAIRAGECINRFLRKQGSEVRNIFVCRYFYSDSLGEIARRFGLHEKKIHTLLRRTRAKLRKFLEKEEIRSWSPDRQTLAAGLNHIDDEIILSAHGSHKKIRRVIPWLGAACVVALVAVCFPYLREAINTDLVLRGPNWREENKVGDAEVAHKPSKESIKESGIPATVGGSTVTVTEVTDTTITLTLVKTDSEPIYAALYDRMGDALGCTEPDYKVDGVTIRPNTVKLYVDSADEAVYEFPTVAGTYTVVVDFTRIRNGQYPMESYMGLFSYVGKDGSPVIAYFSIEPEIPEETVTTEAPSEEETVTAPDT